MRVVVPTASMDDQANRFGPPPAGVCETALERWAPNAERIPVGHHPSAYWQLLSDLWAARASFVIIEHDIEIHQTVMPRFARCRKPWCLHPYGGPGDGFDPLTGSLGCVRFTAALIAAVPDALGKAGDIADGLPARDWRRLDVLLAGQLRQAGYEPHIHQPPVLHHHRYAHGCACGGTH